MIKKEIYVKDSEGYVTSKPIDQVQLDEVVITKQEFENLSGITYYKQKYGRGGARANAGRKKIYIEKVKETYELEKTSVISLKDYAKKHKISKNKAISLAIETLLQKG